MAAVRADITVQCFERRDRDTGLLVLQRYTGDVEGLCQLDPGRGSTEAFEPNPFAVGDMLLERRLARGN